MNMGAYLFTSHTEHYSRSIVRERSLGYAKSSCSPGGEIAQLRPAIEQCSDLPAVELYTGKNRWSLRDRPAAIVAQDPDQAGAALGEDCLL